MRHSVCKREFGGMRKWKVVITARSFGQVSSKPSEILTRAGCEIISSSIDRPLSSDELCGLVSEADAIIVGNDRVSASVVDCAPKLKVISRYGAGVDNIDIQAATARGIVVTNTPGVNDDAVADLTVGLMIALARHIFETVNMVRQGKWSRIMGFSMAGKNVGVIGLGRVGKAVVRRLAGFEVAILAYDPMRDDRFAQEYSVSYVPLSTLLARSDFVTLHTPLTPQTRHLIGAREFSLMKPTAFLINTSRGAVVDEEALYTALKERRIAGAALDVLSHEPPLGNPLITLDNVLVTSHIGGYTCESVDNMGILAATNVVDVLEGRRTQYVVNPEVYGDRRCERCDTARHACCTDTCCTERGD